MYGGITAAAALENLAVATADAHRWGASYAELVDEQLVDQDEDDEHEIAR